MIKKLRWQPIHSSPYVGQVIRRRGTADTYVIVGASRKGLSVIKNVPACDLSDYEVLRSLEAEHEI